jgi:hypothetical protein
MWRQADSVLSWLQQACHTIVASNSFYSHFQPVGDLIPTTFSRFCAHALGPSKWAYQVIDFSAIRSQPHLAAVILPGHAMKECWKCAWLSEWTAAVWSAIHWVSLTTIKLTLQLL